MNLMTICPNPSDITSFYRGFGPLERLKRDIGSLRLFEVGMVDWRTLSAVDAMFIQRPFTQAHVDASIMSKSYNRPVWVDYDDDLFSVPSDNPTFANYNRQEIQKNIAKVCKLADVISVTTEALKKKLQVFNDNVVVVPNAIDDDAFFRKRTPTMPRPKLVNWRGSKTHQRDMFTVATEIIQLSKQNPDWTWNFIGDNLWFMTEKMPDKTTICSPALDIINYHSFISGLNPAIQIVPLADTPFNRSKSNIAWLEGIYSGAIVLAPDWEQWRKPGCVTYKDSIDFAEKLQGLISQFNEGKNFIRENSEAWNYIQQNYTLRTVNELRANILGDLMKLRGKK